MTLEEKSPALVGQELRTKFRGQLLDTFLLYLFTYKMPVDEVRILLDKVETQALRGFPDLAHASWRAEAAEELRDRWLLIENSLVKKAAEAYEKQKNPPGREALEKVETPSPDIAEEPAP